jgi:hypothetical protein
LFKNEKKRELRINLVVKYGEKVKAGEKSTQDIEFEIPDTSEYLE